jgi:hypothetical protein
MRKEPRTDPANWAESRFLTAEIAGNTVNGKWRFTGTGALSRREPRSGETTRRNYEVYGLRRGAPVCALWITGAGVPLLRQDAALSQLSRQVEPVRIDGARHSLAPTGCAPTPPP